MAGIPIHNLVPSWGGVEDCTCEIGEDHDEEGYTELNSLSVSDAADIWRSHGMDEDYMFGYSVEELRDA